ncbi:penicillin-binding protein [Nitratireductor aquimarinus]|uniref:transglycosylase domain-containing protein n=1 Tax=Nitratireductor TaxID=245876 RepID=UPI0019D32902|nr:MULTISPECIES: transglycosylase domain-containing protein [Nitratireductor]MBN7775520.1 penicillin-binding protein [Nitratireductor pacificus]MBN7782014.1 penicillin-binding protein [Nitratireductor pacificus]MBN7790821.1 penicillin-binding protein [Nitratireductor aquimarinus]MBY6100638.1 penicillin-binding protein [Nitratireductor aquimarinus]
MARKTKNRRIEPTFDAPAARRGGDDLKLGDADRVVPSRQRRKPAKGKSTKGGKSARRASPRRKSGAGGSGAGGSGGGGFFGFLRTAVYWSFVLALWGGIAAVGITAYYGAKMPSATTWEIPDRPPNVKIVSADGGLIANRGMTGGEAVGLHEMSPFIPQAVIAIEDRRFYSHFGVDPIGLARAMSENLLAGRLTQGGSTLTQQLAKNLFLKPDRTIERKVQEVLLALWLEQKHSKDQILEMYLNRVYFGSGSYGVEAASRRYFNKSARDVTLSEAALLAGLLKAPSRLSPARDPQAAETRAQVVLTAMRDQGMIGDSEMTTAMSRPATRAAAYWTGSEHYFADRVMEELPGLIGDVKNDIIVEATVDFRLQKQAEKTIRSLIDEKGGKLAVSQGALVSIDTTGAVRAMVGGYDYANSQFDRASEARRQPGSAFKPFVYMAALEQGRRPDSVRNDAPIRIGKWKPENYKGKYYGPVTLSEALARSLNSVAAQLAMEAGPKSVVELAQRMGIESDLKANASIALGTSEVTPLELTAAYLPFATGGLRPEVHFVTRVTTSSGKVLYQHDRPRMTRVASAEVIGMMNSMMQGVVENGSARAAAIGRPAAGKTGTTQQSRDAWFVGYTADLVTGVWFGNDTSKSTRATGSSLPVPAWKAFMEEAEKGRPVKRLPGSWSPGASFGGGVAAQPQERPVPQAAVGSGGNGGANTQASQASEARPTPPAPVPAPVPAPGGGNPDHTASVRRPVPPADVGGAPQHSQTSILDIILGN